MATLNHDREDNRLGAGRPETMRNKRPPGADISFSIPPKHPDRRLTLLPPLLPSPRFQHALLRVIFLSHIPSCAFITFKRARRRSTLFLFFKNRSSLSPLAPPRTLSRVLRLGGMREFLSFFFSSFFPFPFYPPSS